jgi:hypothetical protein
MNVYVDSKIVKFEKVYWEYWFGKRNETGEKVLDYAVAYELAIINTYFRKQEDH